MNDRNNEARVLAQAAFAAAAHCSTVRQLINGYVARLNPEHIHTLVHSDSEKYRWIRGNRGNYAIADALATSDHDKDFDERIVAAMNQSERCTVAILAPGRATRPAGGRKRAPVSDDILAVECTPAAIGRFDEAAGAVYFCVWIDGSMVHASIAATVLQSHYGHATSPMLLFKRHVSALAEAVRDRVCGGSIELIVLRDYDLS